MGRPLGSGWTIPPDLQGRALVMHYQQNSARQIYRVLWPGPDPAPVRVDTFTKALLDLVKETARGFDELARTAGVPTNTELAEAGGDPNKIAELALLPAVMETPLSPGDDEALMHLDQVRGALLVEMNKCMTEPLPTVDDIEYTDDNGNPQKRSRFQGYADPRAMRSSVVAALANAVHANVGIRLRASELRVKRTVALHNLRLANRDEVERIEEEQAKQDDLTVERPVAKRGGFQLIMKS